MSPPLLQVKSLQKFFTMKRGFPNPETVTVRAVDGVTFDVQKGEAFGLVGESGCGKSTVGRGLLRLIEPDCGDVLLDGQDVLALNKARLQAVRRRMQIIFQDPYASLNPRRTVGQTLAEPMVVHEMGSRTEIHERVRSLLNEVGLQPEAVDKFPHEFSGGQRQRVGIARALIFQPDLVIADEPVSALDVSIQSQILLLMRGLQEKRRLSFIFISHDLAVVRYFCQRLAVMYLGRIVEQGTVTELFENPLHPYTVLLREASPIPDPQVRRDVPRIEAEVPSPINPPPGCYFHPRCPKAMDLCRRQYPPWRRLDASRGVACHLNG